MKKKNNWQRKYIKDVFNSELDYKKHYSTIILGNLNLLEKKADYLPKYLFKYYSPTSENILDIQNQRLWLSHPKSFNDPFDCNIGYDIEKYEKKCLLKFIENSVFDIQDLLNGFSTEEKQRIERSYLGEKIYLNIERESFFSMVIRNPASRVGLTQLLICRTVFHQSIFCLAYNRTRQGSFGGVFPKPFCIFLGHFSGC